MKKESLFLLLFLIVFFTLSISAKWYHFNVQENYYLSAAISCDIETESCFISDCDESDEECDLEPYKYIYKNVQTIPECNPYETECSELQCTPDETDDCEIIECSDEVLEEGEICLNTA